MLVIHLILWQSTSMHVTVSTFHMHVSYQLTIVDEHINARHSVVLSLEALHCG
jgi:hypothetical protein